MIKKFAGIFFIGLALVICSYRASAQPLTSSQIDSVTNKVLTAFDVPGIAVGVVKDGKLIHAKGYGVRSLASGKPVDEHTLFGIASNSKAFTSAALGMLMDEGKLNWDTKVTDIIPEFKMYAPYVTEAFTIRDLLTHRSGLGLGAGDLMFWPDSNNFTKKDIIHNLRYLKQVSGFRTKYDYDNLMYIVAGEVIERVYGMNWENFIKSRILQPLGMTETSPTFRLLADTSNVIDPHAPVNGKVQVIRRDWSVNASSAGGIYSNIVDMSKWVMMQINDGKYGTGNSKTLFSHDVHAEMWTPQTIIRTSPGAYHTNFASYGLGWGLRDVGGYLQASHTGGLAGIVTQVTIIPELKLGIIVFTNQQVGAAFTAVTDAIKDGYLGITGADRIGENKRRVDRGRAVADSITTAVWKDIAEQTKANKESVDESKFTGTYHDVWFGDAVISKVNGKLRFTSQRSFLLKGDVYHYKANTFIVKWDDRSLDADAFLMFQTDENGNASELRMKPVSPLTDFSFDFQDLDFLKVSKK